MGFFSKKITTDNIADSLIKFFEMGYGSMVISFKDILKEQNISDEQDKELIAVSMFAIIHAVLAEFGKSDIARKILEKFQHDIINTYFKYPEEKVKFNELLGDRGSEYNKILTVDNKDAVIQIGQIFCNYYCGNLEDKNHLTMMTLVGSTFFNIGVNTKKFLDEILSKYKNII
jgi:hypothetical protein